MTILTNAQFADALGAAIADYAGSDITEAQLKTQLASLVDQWNDGTASRASVAARVSEYFDNDRIWKAEYRNWLAGTLTGGFTTSAGTTAGGPYYPLTNDLGVTVYVMCPVGMLDDLSGGAVTAVEASAAAAATSAATATTAKNDAVTAKNDAVTAKNLAVTKAGEASSSASSAATDAATANTKAGQAATSATNAASSATTATTKAGLAAADADAAAASAADALTAKVAAEAARDAAADIVGFDINDYALKAYAKRAAKRAAILFA